MRNALYILFAELFILGRGKIVMVSLAKIPVFWGTITVDEATG